MATADMNVKSVVPYFGGCRMIAKKIAEELSGLAWIGIPFGGGMPELAHINCRSIVVNDLHRHVVNLAYCIADPNLLQSLRQRVDRLPFAPDVLAQGQEFCASREPENPGDLNAATWYFVTQWMGMSGRSGTEEEFRGGLSVRWTSSGGDSNTRYRSAVRSLGAWHRILRRCNFSMLDCFVFLDKCKDQDGHGIYCDAPWPSDGDGYRHKFTEADQRRLAEKLASFRNCRVVIRYGDHPLIRELYPDSRWTWKEIEGRTQANKSKAEVLITNAARSLF